MHKQRYVFPAVPHQYVEKARHFNYMIFNPSQLTSPCLHLPTLQPLAYPLNVSPAFSSAILPPHFFSLPLFFFIFTSFLSLQFFLLHVLFLLLPLRPLFLKCSSPCSTNSWPKAHFEIQKYKESHHEKSFHSQPGYVRFFFWGYVPMCIFLLLFSSQIIQKSFMYNMERLTWTVVIWLTLWKNQGYWILNNLFIYQ